MDDAKLREILDWLIEQDCVSLSGGTQHLERFHCFQILIQFVWRCHCDPAVGDKRREQPFMQMHAHSVFPTSHHGRASSPAIST